MLLSNLFMAVTALASSLVGGQQQQPGLRYYHCEFAPGIELFVSGNPLLPGYRCAAGTIQLLIASKDFRAPYSNTEWIEEVDLQLSDEVLTQVFPGKFRYVRGSVHRPVHGLEFKSPTLAINGLTVLDAYYRY